MEWILLASYIYVGHGYDGFEMVVAEADLSLENVLLCDCYYVVLFYLFEWVGMWNKCLISSAWEYLKVFLFNPENVKVIDVKIITI